MFIQVVLIIAGFFLLVMGGFLLGVKKLRILERIAKSLEEIASQK